MGETHYVLDSATEATGTVVNVVGVGEHTLEFWSVDAANNAEQVHTTITFTIVDLTPPTTTSDAQATYTGTATIALSAADNPGGSGVFETYYLLDADPQATGTSVTVTSAGQHTLQFWSVDVAGNIESPLGPVTFTVE